MASEDQASINKTTEAPGLRAGAEKRVMAWRRDNAVTDWEFSQIGVLVCDNAPRDLALMIVRLDAQIALIRHLKECRRNQAERIEKLTRALETIRDGGAPVGFEKIAREALQELGL